MKKTATYEDLLAENQALKELVSALNGRVGALEASEKKLAGQVAYLLRRLYGPKPDRIKDDPNQLRLFDEEFKKAVGEKAEEVQRAAEEIEREAAKRRNKAKKQPSRPATYRYSGLEERVTTLLPEGVDPALCDTIGKDIIRILHCEPARMWIEQIELPVLRLKADKGAPNPRIYQAPAPKGVIGGNHAGADLLAQLVVDKYRHHLPEYRQVKRYADMGLRLPASTINGWIHAVASRLEPLYEALRRDIRRGDYLQVDEVPWRIADKPQKSRRGYAWQFLDSRPRSHGLYFLYVGGSRAGTIPRAELRDFRGALQTDGYKVYDYFEQQDNVTLLGCMAHVRRKFTDAQKSHPRLAAQAVEWIGKLYALEANLQERRATAEEVAAERQAKALPLMDAMEQWMKAVCHQCTPSDPMGKAFDYAYKLWPRLRRYADDGRYHIDNNPVERGQRPTVMGRKNYLFSKTNDGAVDNAIFYSLLGSCDVVGLEPLRWLTDVLGTLQDDTTPEQLKQLLPYYYKESRQ